MTFTSQQKWMRLDNAAIIYPAAMSKEWMALFRLSMNLTEAIDPVVLQRAVNDTLKRFPAFAQRLRRGFFWHYMEHNPNTLAIQNDVGNPCVRMNLRENQGFMLRVRYHENRIAVEFFHALTDGSGGMSFLKTLVAQYIELKHGSAVPRGGDILSCDEQPDHQESEDAFLRYARSETRALSEPASYLIPGTEEDHFMHIITGVTDLAPALEAAKAHGGTLTEFLAGVLIQSIQGIQSRHTPNRRRHKPVKICIPVNLRKLYPSKTVRNFASYINPGIEPKYGNYTLGESVKKVHGIMAVELDEKLINAKFSTNVKAAGNPALRLAPLFLKKPALSFAFMINGDRQASSLISNLGAVEMPAIMREKIERVDFMVGSLKRNNVACGCLSFNGKLILNFTRKIAEPHVERGFFTALVKLGLKVKIESNQRW